MDTEIRDVEERRHRRQRPGRLHRRALHVARRPEPLVIEGFAWGGLLQQTTDVENYPGYPEGVMGPEMMQQFGPGGRFGTRFITDDATRLELASEPGGVHTVHVGGKEIKARAVILAMGAEPKKLGVPGEEELAARGSRCATCDAAFFRGKQTIVVGGGDTAMEDATFLSKFADRVGIVHRRPSSAPPRSCSTAHARPTTSIWSRRMSSRASTRATTARAGQLRTRRTARSVSFR